MKQDEEEKKMAAQSVQDDPARQSHSQGFMKNMDQSIMNKQAKLPTLPDLANSRLSAVSYQNRQQPVEELISEPAATAQPANITGPSQPAGLEERKLRLEAQRDALRKKK